MQLVMDRLMASLTEIDNVIHRQRRAMATVAAIENISNMETARSHIRKAQFALIGIEGDALPARASSMQQQTPTPPPGERGP